MNNKNLPLHFFDKRGADFLCLLFLFGGLFFFWGRVLFAGVNVFPNIDLVQTFEYQRDKNQLRRKHNCDLRKPSRDCYKIVEAVQKIQPQRGYKHTDDKLGNTCG